MENQISNPKIALNSQKLIKIIPLSILLIIESFILSTQIFGYVKTSDYFIPQAEPLIEIALIMLILMFTFSLTIGGWDKYEHYLFVGLSIPLGIFFAFARFIPVYAMGFAVIAYIILFQGLYNANKLKDSLLKPNVRFSLSHSVKGITFIFAVLAAALTFVTIQSEGLKFDLGKEISKVIFQEKTSEIASDVFTESLNSLNSTVKNSLEEQISAIVKPYQNYVIPIIVIIVFGVFEFIATIVYFAYLLLIDFVFLFAIKTGFIKIQQVPTTKEVLTF